jgi:hypothetical protein
MWQTNQQQLQHMSWYSTCTPHHCLQSAAALPHNLVVIFHQDFVLREFQEVYGPHNVVAVHIVSYSPRIAKLVQQYNMTRLALEDMLDHYSKQLHDAAAAGRRRKRSRVAAVLAAPFAVLARCCSSSSQPQLQHQHQHHLQHQHRAVLKPINVRTVSCNQCSGQNSRSKCSIMDCGRQTSIKVYAV